MRFVVVLTALVITVSVSVASTFDAAGACPSEPSALLLHAPPAGARQPRWSGCFDRPRRMVPRPSLVTPLQVRGAVAAFEMASQRRGARTIQSLGAALALSGNLSRAIATLNRDESAQRQPDGLSNLAAAHLLAGDEPNGTTNLVRALEYASHALVVEPGHLPALFNRALALEALRLDAEAVTAWGRYLELDAASAWSDEARARLAAIHERAPSAAAAFDDEFLHGDIEAVTLARLCIEAPQICRQRLEETVLPDWASAWLIGDTNAAAAALSRARVLAEALRNRGDVLDAETVADLDRAVRANQSRLREIALGLQSYGQARRTFEDDGESIPLFVAAESQLTRADSPLAGWARANRVYAEFNTYSSERLASVASELHEWTAAAFSRGYPALAGRLAYLEALTFVNRAQYANAEPLMQASLDALQRTRERDHLAATYVLMAGARMRLGDIDAGWDALKDALTCLPDILSARRQYTVLLGVGGWLRQRGLHYAAIELLSSARRTAEQSGQLLRIAESSLDRAKAYSLVGQAAAARADLETARPDPDRNGRWGRGERARYEYLAGVAEVEQDRRPPVAIAAASEALTFFEGRAAAQRLAPLHLVRGRAYLAAGDRDAADADFSAGIDAYLHYRSGLSSAQQRVLSQEVIWDLYDARLQLAASGSPESAFLVAEQGRARTLVEALGGGERDVIPLRELQRELGSDTRVVYFALLSRHLLVWVVGRDAVGFRRVPIVRPMLERSVTTLVSALEEKAPDGAWRTLAEQLHDQLITPIADLIPSGAPLVVVPDGVLHRLPFAALRDRRSGQYLIVTHAVTTAPSATVLARLLARRTPGGAPASLFAVSDPAVTGRDSAALPGAERETAAITRLYAHASLVSRAGATRSAFLKGAPSADVVHFAGHVIANPEYPLLGRLEFADAADAPGEGILAAEDIAGMHLDHTRLVVLAACTTAGGSVYRGEGVLSLARPFLSAGVPSVVATLWDIDDEASATFLGVFHEEFVKGGGAGRALRAAQVSALTTLPPGTWAAFVLVGRPGGPAVFDKDGSR